MIRINEKDYLLGTIVAFHFPEFYQKSELWLQCGLIIIFDKLREV